MNTLGDLATTLAAEWIAQRQPSVPSNKREFMQFATGLCPIRLYDALMGANEHLDWVLARASQKVEGFRSFERSLGATVEEDGA